MAHAAVLQTAEAQKDLGTLQARFAPRQAQLQALDNEVEALRKQVSDNKLSEAERETRQQSLDKKEKQRAVEAMKFAEESSWPDPITLEEDVFA